MSQRGGGRVRKMPKILALLFEWPLRDTLVVRLGGAKNIYFVK
jgi:hypothetical protein